MRRLLILALLLAALSACSRDQTPIKSPPTTTTTILAPKDLSIAQIGAAAQKIEGFGASGAWWPIDLANFPAGPKQTAASMLFDQLQLSGYRYNIGGGGKGVKDPSRAPKQVPDDTAGLTFLHAASDAHVPVLTGFVNSAPPQFTTNGKTCGGALKPGSENAFAQYLVDMVKLIHDKEHITLQYVSPMNEPDDSFADCGQEGMAVPLAQRAPLVQAVGKLLAAQAPYTKVIADESSTTFLFSTQVPKWMSTPGTAQYVDKLVHHTYEYPTPAMLKKVAAVGKQFDKSTWMTEICCYSSSAKKGGQNFDPTMTNALWLADDIYNALVYANDSAYYWWTAFSSKTGCDNLPSDLICAFKQNDKGWNDGLAYYDADYANSHFYTTLPTKRFAVMRQFSRFVRPGAIRHDVTGLPDGVKVMAFADGGQWTVVAWNSTESDKAVGVQFPAGTPALTPGIPTRTIEELTTKPVDLPTKASNGSWFINMPPQSVATYTFK